MDRYANVQCVKIFFVKGRGALMLKVNTRKYCRSSLVAGLVLPNDYEVFLSLEGKHRLMQYGKEVKYHKIEFM